MNGFFVFALLLSFSLWITFLVLYIKNIQEFKRLRKLRNDFTAMIIHELRSPLSLVRSSADMLLKRKDVLSPGQNDKILIQIRSSATDLLDIVNDLLDVAKIENGKVEIFKADTNLVEFLKREVEIYKPLARKKGIAVNLHASDKPIFNSCDPDKLKHVLSNLLSNAIKFTEGGEIVVSLESFSDYVQLSVSDTGIGIPDDIKSTLFNKFVQGRQLPVSREKGTGLGLVIVKGIVEAHGGKVWVEDNLPKGTKFVFTLPC